jgi:arylsulfatase A-like enzyme
MMRIVLTVFSSLLLTATVYAQAKPNIIIILADDLGYGDLGCYGQRNIETSNLDRMAKEGMRFTQFYAGSTVCAPSRCVLMTGLHTGHCQIRGNTKTDLKPGTITIASVLKQAAYATGHFGKWGLAYPNGTGLPTRQGFDEFLGYYDQMHAHNYYPTYLWKNEVKFPLRNVVPQPRKDGAGQASEKGEYSPDVVTNAVLDFVERNKAKPFFVYWATTIPHANNEARPHGMEVPDLGRYAGKDWPEAEKGFAAMITRLDRDIGRLLEKLKSLDLDENTLVIFTSDNGPHREGGHKESFFQSQGNLRGIKRDLYEGGIRVPMIARWPGHVPSGLTSDFVGQFCDFLPTCASIAGGSVPDNLDGIDMLPTLQGQQETQSQHEYLYWEFYEGAGAQAVRSGKWKGVSVSWGAPLQLYDLEKDVAEKTNLAASHPEIINRFATAIKQAHVPSPDYAVDRKVESPR